eukprot:7628128-Alexandrium_andersonii.AAC.1
MRGPRGHPSGPKSAASPTAISCYATRAVVAGNKASDAPHLGQREKVQEAVERSRGEIRGG